MFRLSSTELDFPGYGTSPEVAIEFPYWIRYLQLIVVIIYLNKSLEYRCFL
jgi:hypothetical protein